MVRNIKCCWEGKSCTGKAKYQIGFKAWAMGWPKTSVPIEPRFNLGVCEECKPSIKVEHFLLPEGCALINNGLLQKGKQPCDFTTAELCLHEIEDGEMEYFNPDGSTKIHFKS